MADTAVIHRRIDYGVKRGPRQKPKRPRADNGQYLPVLPKDPETIKGALEDYCAGMTLKQIGDKWKVSREAIYAWTLGKLAPNEHEELVRRAITARIARADTMLETAPEPVNVTRGREMARFARQDYERLRPELYGQHIAQTVEVNHKISIEASLTGSARELFQSIRGVPNKIIDLQPDTAQQSLPSHKTGENTE